MKDDYREHTRTTVGLHDQPDLCHRCEGSIGGPGAAYVVATYRGDRRVPLCRSCGERRGPDDRG